MNQWESLHTVTIAQLAKTMFSKDSEVEIPEVIARVQLLLQDTTEVWHKMLTEESNNSSEMFNWTRDFMNWKLLKIKAILISHHKSWTSMPISIKTMIVLLIQKSIKVENWQRTFREFFIKKKVVLILRETGTVMQTRTTLSMEETLPSIPLAELTLQWEHQVDTSILHTLSLYRTSRPSPTWQPKSSENTTSVNMKKKTIIDCLTSSQVVTQERRETRLRRTHKGIAILILELVLTLILLWFHNRNQRTLMLTCRQV